MCGIFAYLGNKNNAAELVFRGLQALEYRGYDSWGIAVKQNQKLLVEKHVGKIGSSHSQLPKSNLGIGHTRWATHGGVTTHNAHPHLDCRQEIAVVHNGIIENFEELKKHLLKQGHTFSSTTDTEVVPHLIEEHLKNEGFASSVRDTFNQLKGLNAIVVLYAPSREIIAAKTGSPLVVGKNGDNLFIASDSVGILNHAKNVLFLEDNHMVILDDQTKLIRLPDGTPLVPHFQNLEWRFEEAEKGNFKHFLLKEIFEQPHVLENIAQQYESQITQLSTLIKSAFGTFMIACGSASYAALYGVYLFSKVARRHVNFSIGSEFTYLEDYLTPKSLVIALSQSGETMDVVLPIREAKKKGSKIVALVNVLGSTLYRLADYKILLGAGPEKAVIATKSLTVKFALLILLVYDMVGKLPTGKQLIIQAENNVKSILKEEFLRKIKRLAKMLHKEEHIFVIGRGLSYPAALETTLKIKETTYIHAEGFAGGELKHGVIALVEKGTPVITLAPNDETYDDIISNSQEIAARGGVIIGIGPKNNKIFNVWLPTDDCGVATTIPQIVIAQLLAYYLALERGIKDPDKPRNLAKSVTVK